MYSNTPPKVQELIDELEKKTRVPKDSIRVMFKGQSLTSNNNLSLAEYGIFSGSRLVMVGDRLPPKYDAIFRRILGINKDIGLIETGYKDAHDEYLLIENVLFQLYYH
jgi:hypothetical protein